MASLLQAHYNSTPLGLKFRPDDIFCAPIASHKEKVTGLVVKVKRKRKKVLLTQPQILYNYVVFRVQISGKTVKQKCLVLWDLNMNSKVRNAYYVEFENHIKK